MFDLSVSDEAGEESESRIEMSIERVVLRPYSVMLSATKHLTRLGTRFFAHAQNDKRELVDSERKVLSLSFCV